MDKRIIDIYKTEYRDGSKANDECYLGSFEVLQMIRESHLGYNFIGRNIKTDEIDLILSHEIPKTVCEGAIVYEVHPLNIPTNIEINLKDNESRCKIVTLCGSKRFLEDFKSVKLSLISEGYVVLTPEIFDIPEDTVFTDELHKRLDDIHRTKMDIADVILVINPGGYIGNDTKLEIEYAKSKGMKISYLHPIDNTDIKFDLASFQECITSNNKFKYNDCIKITGGPKESLIGKIGYYISPYPCPEGDSGHIIMIDDNKINIPEAVEFTHWYGGFANGSTPKFEIYDRVIVISNPYYKGITGIIQTYDYVGKDINYHVIPDDNHNTSIIIKESDLMKIHDFIDSCEIPAKLLNKETASNNSMDSNMNQNDPYGLDQLAKYIDKEQIKSIAEKIYETKISEFVDNILNNRSEYGMGSITDQILAATCEKYVNKLADKFEDDFLKRVHEEIHRDTPVTEDESTFRSSLVYKLQKVGEDYIDKHTDEIWEIMKETIHSQSKQVASSKLIDALSKKTKDNFYSMVDAILVASKIDQDKE